MSLTDIEASIPSQPTTDSMDTIRVVNDKQPAGTRHDQPLVVVPAGLIADLVGSIAPTVGKLIGGHFGYEKLGETAGQVAEPLIKLAPFQVVVPGVAGADGQVSPQDGEPLVVVPAGFFGGVLGGIAGNVLGGTVGGWLGNKDLGATAGKAGGTALGALLPFQVVPPQYTPQSVGPDGGSADEEPMVVVPAGFFGNLLSGATNCFGGMASGTTAGDIAKTASPLLKLLPFQTVAPEFAPQSAGPGGQDEEMVLVPAGFFGNMLSNLAESVGGQVGSMFGDRKTGSDIGKAAAPFIGMLPFSAVPPQLVPQSAGPSAAGEQMMFVPAGLFGGLLKSWGGALGSVVGQATGNDTIGAIAGKAATTLGSVLPFSVVPAQA
ncbi:MAG: hypothetical protein ACK5MT_10935, partial [Actinomycetales bacterium]